VSGNATGEMHKSWLTQLHFSVSIRYMYIWISIFSSSTSTL